MSMTNVGGPLRVGGAVGRGNLRGAGAGGLTSPITVYEITPVQLSPTAIALAQAVAGAGNLTLSGALSSGGVATFDVARCVTITSTNAGDTTQTATFTGTDAYGVTLIETVSLNGAATISGVKAFKTISRVAISAATTGNISAGSGDKFGVPYRINRKGSIQAFWDATWNLGTVTLAVSTAATATSGDVRGTYLPASASDGTRTLALWVFMDDVESTDGLYGVAQFGS